MSVFRTTETATNNGRRFNLGIIQSNPVVIVISNATQQAYYTAGALLDRIPSGAVIGLGNFTAPDGMSADGFAGPAQFRSVDVGRYQYVLNPGGRPIVVTIHVNTLNIGVLPPSGILRRVQ